MFNLNKRHQYKDVPNLEGEIWKSIENYNFYLVSNYGRIKVLGHTLVDKSTKTRNIPTRIMLGIIDSNTGKHTVNLNEKGVITTYNTDYLVMKTFSGIDKTCLVIHKDSDELNCNYSNLEYGSMSSNNELDKKEAKFKVVQVVDGLKIDMAKLFSEKAQFMDKYAKRFAVERYINSKLKLIKDACAVMYVIDTKKLFDNHRYDYICSVVDEIINVNKFELK